MKRLTIIYLLTVAAFAQQNALILPWTPQQFTDTTGRLLTSGKVCTYLAGTSTGTATFTDSTASVSNNIPPNAILLDSTARPTSGGIWLTPSKAYKIVTMTAGTDSTCNTGVVIKTQDNVVAQNGAGLTTNNIFTGANTFQNANAILHVGPNAYTTIALAVAAAGSNPTIIQIDSNYTGTECPASTVANLTFWDLRGGGSPPGPCVQNSVSWNNTSGSGLITMQRVVRSTSTLNASGQTSLYSQTFANNATATGLANFDGGSTEADFTGTLSGTVNIVQGGEFPVVVNSTGGTITTATGAIGYLNTLSGSTTAVTSAFGIKGLGCNSILGGIPVNCYGLYGVTQKNQGSSRNYALGFEGQGLILFDSGASVNRAGLDFEDNAHAIHQVFQSDSSNNFIIRATGSPGHFFQDNTGTNQVRIDSTGLRLLTNVYSNTAGAVSLGLASNPFSGLVIGTAATNAFTFTPAATTAARTISIPDPGVNTNLALNLPVTSAAFATATTAGTCVQNTTAVAGATTSMVASVSPVSSPGVGAQWSAFVSSAGNVTINECAVATSAGGTIAFNIRVTP